MPATPSLAHGAAVKTAALVALAETTRKPAGLNTSQGTALKRILVATQDNFRSVSAGADEIIVSEGPGPPREPLKCPAILAAVMARHDGSRRSSSSRSVGVAVFTAIVIATEVARATCSLVQIRTEPVVLAEDWQAAVVSLMEQTQRAGMPWSCAGGALLVRLDDTDRAVLRFRDPEGREVERHVPSPRSLVATAEALLARSSLRRAPQPPAVDEAERALERPTFDDEAAHRSTAPARPEPRVFVDGTLGIRFSGPSAALWFASELRATMPFAAWSVGLWVRYGLPYVFDIVPPGFTMSQANLGFSAGRLLLTAPVEIRVALNPSLSVVTMDADPGDHEASGAKVDFYLGASLGGAIPFSPRWRGVVVLDAELVPAGIRAERRIDPALPALPTYEVGAAFGVELVTR